MSKGTLRQHQGSIEHTACSIKQPVKYTLSLGAGFTKYPIIFLWAFTNIRTSRMWGRKVFFLKFNFQNVNVCFTKITNYMIVIQMQIVYRVRSDNSSLPHLLLSSSQITTVNFKKCKNFKEVTIPSLLSGNTCPQYFMNIISDFSHL